MPAKPGVKAMVERTRRYEFSFRWREGLSVFGGAVATLVGVRGAAEAGLAQPVDCGGSGMWRCEGAEGIGRWEMAQGVRIGPQCACEAVREDCSTFAGRES